MKMIKYTFITPLFGSISCEELLSDTDGHIELSPEQMCRMYDKGPDLLLFLSENIKDLAPYAPEELKDVVFRAEFGDCALMSGQMWLRTYIWVERDLTEDGIKMIEDWITGQMSDGWGEGLEQRPWYDDTVGKPVIRFNEYSGEFEEDYEDCYVSYYVHPWNSEEFEIFLEDREEVEEEIEMKVVATMALPYHSRQVIKLKGGFALRMFLKDFNLGMEFAEEIEDSIPTPDFRVYLVRDLEGESGVEILHKWVCQHDAFCVFNDVTLDEEVRGVQMPISKAILELLK